MEESKYPVLLKRIVKERRLEPVHLSASYKTDLVTTSDINRPGLQLTGFYDFFDPRRIQIIGKMEDSYFSGLKPERQRDVAERFMSEKPCALIVCHGVKLPEEFLKAAIKYDVNVFETEEETSEFSAALIGTLLGCLAPRETRHGVLVEVYGEGVLITGDSGVGKSEATLELIERGHRLIADDAVEIKRTASTVLTGRAPKLIRYYMEVRGIGIIDVRHTYGVGAVKPSQHIDMVLNLEMWQTGKLYDRLGLETEMTSILGVELPYVNIPVRPGRNLATLIELAAMNNRQKKMGYNAARELAESHDRAVDNIGQSGEEEEMLNDWL